MTFYEFQTTCVQRIAGGDATAWWLNDWMWIGEDKFGKKKAMQAAIGAGLVADPKGKRAATKQPKTDT